MCMLVHKSIAKQNIYVAILYPNHLRCWNTHRNLVSALFPEHKSNYEISPKFCCSNTRRGALFIGARTIGGCTFGLEISVYRASQKQVSQGNWAIKSFLVIHITFQLFNYGVEHYSWIANEMARNIYQIVHYEVY